MKKSLWTFIPIFSGYNTIVNILTVIDNDIYSGSQRTVNLEDKF